MLEAVDVFEMLERLEDPKALGVEPMRIKITSTNRAGETVSQLLERRPAPVDARGTLAILNTVEGGEQIPAGTILKWVKGEAPPDS